MVGWFAEVCRRRKLKGNIGKIKEMVLKEEEGMECWVHVGGNRLEHFSEFKYLECVLDESGTNGAECSRKVAIGRRVKSAIRSLVNVMNLQTECTRVLHEILLVPVRMYGSMTML